MHQQYLLSTPRGTIMPEDILENWYHGVAFLAYLNWYYGVAFLTYLNWYHGVAFLAYLNWYYGVAFLAYLNWYYGVAFLAFLIWYLSCFNFVEGRALGGTLAFRRGVFGLFQLCY